MVLKNKDQKKSSSKISDDDNSSNDDDRHTISISSKDSIQSELQLADPDAFVKEDDGSFVIIETVDVEQPTFDDAKHVKLDDSSSDTEKENDSLPAPEALQVNLDESTHEEGSVQDGNEQMESVKLKDDTSRAFQDDASQDECRSTLSQSQGVDQISCIEDLKEENSFVPGAAVHIIKGTNKGKCGIISRVTDKCVFISISGLDKDVRKTKSNEFLQFSNQKTTCNKQQHNSSPQEIFLQGNSVRIKKGSHRGCQGIISRTTEKCVFISITGFPKDVRKKKSVEFLQLLNDDTNYELQGIDDQACAAEAEETSEVNVFDVGRQVRVIKGNHLGKCGVISRVTNKSVFASIEGMSKDIRKSKSDKFLQIMQSIG